MGKFRVVDWVSRRRHHRRSDLVAGEELEEPVIHGSERYWYHPEPKPGEPHEPRNTPWPGDILRQHAGSGCVRVIANDRMDLWVAYEWVERFLGFLWWRSVSKDYMMPLVDWYNFAGNMDVVKIARKQP